MPTQLLTVDQVLTRYGGVIDRFLSGPDDHPIAAGLPPGRVTDDTDQAMIVAHLLVQGSGRVDPYALVAALQAWERRMSATGSADLLGPSTKRALERIAAGEDVATAGADGTTNGAAMRITPVGICTPTEPLAELIAVVTEVCRPTHGASVAIAGAGAIAAAVSAGMDGADVADAVILAQRAAAEAEPTGGRLAVVISAAVTIATEDPEDSQPVSFLRRIDREIGSSLATHESVPAALAVALRWPTSPWDAARHGATLGGDSDTIAAMAGAVVGACCGASAIPAEQLVQLRAANPGLDLASTATDLLALRQSKILD
jgi:ADP-ribosylglycohydrolase